MARFRSTLTLILVLITAFLVSCGSPTVVTQSPAAAAAQLERIQQYQVSIKTLRDRLPELATLIENRRWTDVQSFIHGPMGELRAKMGKLARDLSPAAQDQALEASKGVFGHLVEIDEAAQKADYRQAIRNYAETIKDFDAFLAAVPKA